MIGLGVPVLFSLAGEPRLVAGVVAGYEQGLYVIEDAHHDQHRIFPLRVIDNEEVA